MAQDFGAAQPIADWVKKYMADPLETLGKTAEKVPSGSKKADTSWHDEMVKRANESFRQQSKPPQKKAQRKPARKR